MTGRRMLCPVVVWVTLLVLVGTTAPVSAANRAPEFTLPDVAGNDVRLEGLLERGPVIVDFWATWCKPCIKAFPGLQRIFDNYRDCGLSVVTVSIDGPRTTSRVASLIKSKGYTFGVLLDQSQKVARKFHVSSVPRTFLIDANGEIVLSLTGYRPGNEKQLEAAMAKLFPGDCSPPEDTSDTDEPAAGEPAGEESVD